MIASGMIPRIRNLGPDPDRADRNPLEFGDFNGARAAMT